MLPRKKCEEIKAVEMPPIKEYLKEIQRDGSELGADEVLKDTLKWLDSRGLKNAVSMQMVEQYAFSVARWIHLERLISKYGYIAKHPTTGAPIQSPVSYTHLRAHETLANLVCRLLLEKIFFNDTATTEIYTLHIVGSVRCV